jgi:hypothetical protein
MGARALNGWKRDGAVREGIGSEDYIEPRYPYRPDQGR